MRYLFIVILGSLLHFVYEWSGDNFIVGLFSPVNESVWEHLKLLFFPMLFLTVWDFFTKEDKKLNFLPARVSGILAGYGFIVTAYYTITGVLEKNIDWINIAIFLLGVGFSFLAERKVAKGNSRITPKTALILLIILLLLFMVFTVAPPKLGLFRSEG